MKKITQWASGGAVVLIALIIRLLFLTQSPPSPYWEEVALGYDAYSILLTGKDHHGNPWPVVAFESFGDWKPSGYFYALVPFLKVFGLNVLSVRLPSVVAGAGIVAGLGVLMWQFSAGVFSVSARRKLVGIALAVGTLSPWLIQFSRGAWEVNLATFWIVWGVVCGWQATAMVQQKKTRFLWLMVSALLLVASTYTYHSTRILAPLLGVVIAWQFMRVDWAGRRKNIDLIAYAVVALIVGFSFKPFVDAWGTPVLTQRLAEAGSLQTTELVERSNSMRELHDNSLISRALYHRYALMAQHTAQQFVSHLNLDFLFVSGDANPRHSSQYFGLLYPFEIVFLLVGLGAFSRLSAKNKTLLVIWFAGGILPAALAKDAPHALRILPVAPVFLLSVAFGIWTTFEWFKKQRAWLGAVCAVAGVGLYLFFFTALYRHLLVVYPKQFASEWQYGYQEMIASVAQLQTENPDLPVYITREYGRPAMYYWFYTKTDPSLVQEAQKTARFDQGEFLTFQNIFFVSSLSEATEKPAILAGFSSNTPWGAEVVR